MRRGTSQCDRVSHRILIAGIELGRLGSSRCEEALELALAFPKKNGRCLGGPLKFKILIPVYQRTCCGANLSDNPPKKSGHTSRLGRGMTLQKNFHSQVHSPADLAYQDC